MTISKMVRMAMMMALVMAVVLFGCGEDGNGDADADSDTDSDADSDSDADTDSDSDGASCEGVTCSGHGTCLIEDNAAVCQCDDNYHAAGVLCIADNSTDLCEGLITDTGPHPMSPLAKPPVGEAITDPDFGTTLRRITDVGGTGVIKPMYSPAQAWNADETYLILYQVDHGHLLYNGQTYEYIRDLSISPPDLEQVYWSTDDPDLLYWIDGNQLMRYRVSDDASERVHTIDCSGDVSADSHAWISWDANRLGLYCDSTNAAFIYSISDGAILGSSEERDFAPSISASGTLAYWGGDVVDATMAVVRTLDLSSDGEHCSLGMLENGHDTYNLVQFDEGPEGSGVGSLVTFDMTDGSSRVIIGPDTGYPYPPSGTHISAPIYKRPGWVFVSIIGDADGAEPLHQELVLANTNPGGTVCRIAHHRSVEAQDYWGEPHVTGSPSGTRAIFGSDWSGGDSVDTWVVELPSFVAAD